MIDKITTEVLLLIKQYISCSKYMCDALRDTYNIKEETLLGARRMSLLPKEGMLEEGFTYSFHGGGCYFEFENGTIDVEFGPNGRCDGFDAYRLHDFLITSKKNEYKYISSSKEIQEAIDHLFKYKKIIQLKQYPNDNLYYLNTEEVL
jgi:hypothetical protein